MEISGNTLYNRAIHIHDPDLYCETSLKKKDFDIRFKNDGSVEKAKGDIFSKTTKTTTLAVSVDKGNLLVGITVSKFTTYTHFKNIIAAVLHIHADCLINDEESLITDPEGKNTVESRTVIGDHEFSFTIQSSTKSRVNGYENMSLPIINKITQLTINSSTKYTVHPRISEVQYVLYNKSITEIDVVRLMNLNNTLDLFSRIYLHSSKLNDFNDERSMQKGYIKAKVSALSPSYGVDLYRNVCTFYYNKAISDKENYIRLHQINVFQNGVITLTFKNINFDFSFDSLVASIENFIKTGFKKIFASIHIEEAIYKLTVPQFQHMFLCCNFGVEIPTKIKMSQVVFLNAIPGFKSVYTMKSSERVFGPQEYGQSSDLLMARTNNITQYYQETLLNYNYATIIQVNQNPSSGLISINNCTNIDFGLTITAMIMNKFTIDSKTKKPHAKTTDDIVDYLCSVDSKVRLKQLRDSDPILFDVRNVNGKPNSYSQLVQKDSQRPSVISKEDYDIIKKSRPNSVLDIENQTTHERLYLVCPFKDNPVINYHDFANQLCIPKCTMAFNNENQFRICDSGLGGQNEKTVSNEFSSTTIIKFSAVIDAGRRCFPPYELINVFPKHYFLKLPSDGLVQAYVGQKFGLRTFLIERCDGYYKVLTEFIYPNQYAIVLREENTNHHLILCELATKSPFIMQKDSDIPFVQQLIRTSMYRHDISYLIRYVNNVCKTDFDPSMKLMDFVKEFGTKLNIKFINKQDDISIIMAMIYDGHIYFVPRFFNLGFPSINMRDIMSLDSFKEPYPKLTDLDPSGIEKQYIDFDRKDVVAVKYYGTDTLIMPTKNALDLPKEFLDYQPFIFKTFGFKPEIIPKPSSEQSIIHVNDLLRLMITITMKMGLEANLESIEKMFKSIISDKNELSFINGEVSWRQSKVNAKLIKNINFDKIQIMKLIYESLRSEYTIRFNVTHEHLYTVDENLVN